jgi:alkylation response protein AidB-like acyl-CoA dehydrogenase
MVATSERSRRAELVDEVRRFVDANPTDTMPRDISERFAWLVRYQRRLHEAGLAVPSWPERFGGRSVLPADAIVVLEELGRARSPELINFVAVEVVAPALMAFVEDDRLARWLPDIASADEVWCQLFSEPDAGSDLASLRTRAVEAGGGWVISGRKVWSTWAQFAGKGLILARTGTSESRHRGITAFVIDMHHPGVEVRPLVTMTGAAEFAEVTFDDVPVGTERLVGEVNGGWAVALNMLANERGPYGLRRAAVVRAAMEGVRELARSSSSCAGRAKAVDAYIAMWLLDRRIAAVAADIEARRPVGDDAPVTKMALTTAEQKVYDAAQDLLGLAGIAGLDEGWTEGWLYSRAASIYGGSAQIQRNVIGERILGLPPEPRPAR